MSALKDKRTYCGRRAQRAATKKGPRTPDKPRPTQGHRRVKNTGDRQLNSFLAAKFRGEWRQFRNPPCTSSSASVAGCTTWSHPGNEFLEPIALHAVVSVTVLVMRHHICPMVNRSTYGDMRCPVSLYMWRQGVYSFWPWISLRLRLALAYGLLHGQQLTTELPSMSIVPTKAIA